MSIEEGFKPSAHYDTERVKGTWVLKVLAWMHLCLWSVIKKWKNKWNYSDNKNLFKISKLKKRRSLVLHCHVICLTLNSLFFFLLVIPVFILRYMFLHELLHFFVPRIFVFVIKYHSQSLTMLYVTHVYVKKICTTKFVFDFLNTAAEISSWNYKSIS